MNIPLEEWTDRVFRFGARELSVLEAREENNTKNEGNEKLQERMREIVPSESRDYFADNAALLHFFGPEGCGKYSAAESIFRRLVGEENTFNKYVRLSGSMLSEEATSAAEVRNRINKIFEDVYGEDGNALALLVEDLDECVYATAAAGEFSINIRECSFGYPILAVFISKSEDRIPSVLSRELEGYEFTLPDYDERVHYISSALKKSVFSPSKISFFTGGSTEEEKRAELDALCEKASARLATASVGMSYRQLKNYVKNFETENEFCGLHEVSVEQFVKPEKEQDEEKQLRLDVYRALIGFLNNPVFTPIGGAITASGTTGGGTKDGGTPPKLPESPEPPESVEGLREKLEKMSSVQLTVELFGEERGNELIAFIKSSKESD